MKASLDHIGIAVRNVDEALAFYRDALGLAVHPHEEVASQGIRAHVIPLLGGSALELLEAVRPDSPVAKYLERRGPGLHHITLRVDDIEAALAELRNRGIRLVDERPRPGAEAAMIAFIHPSAAHGVLVELKQSAQPPRSLEAKRLAWGGLELTSVHDGTFRLDGGAMFGVVPRPLWELVSPPDDRNRILLGMRPLVVRGEWGRMIIDCGAGDKMNAKQRDIYSLERHQHLDHALAQTGLTSDSIEVVLATHLHFDHFGGATARVDGRIVPRFSRARYVIRAAEWHDAIHPNERNRASYLQEDFVPLKDAGVVDFFEDDQAIKPGVRVVRTGGHTAHHQIVFIESGGKTAVFTADLIPTTGHIRDPWVMGYDLFPMDTLAFKRQFIREAIDREYLIFFEHDPVVAAGYIREKDGRRYVEQVL
jgi:methylmalonyl-CoA epimerase